MRACPDLYFLHGDDDQVRAVLAIGRWRFPLTPWYSLALVYGAELSECDIPHKSHTSS